MERYKEIVVGFISGHTHSEAVVVVHEYSDREKPLILNYVSSGLTTFSQYQPSFRIYEVKKETKEIQDYIQYRLDLIESNKAREAIWFISYKATELFNVTSMSDVEGVSKFIVNSEYVKHHFTDVPGSEEKSKQEAYIKEETCNFNNDDLEDKYKCKAISLVSHDYLMHIMDKIFKGWKKKENNNEE